MLPILTYIAATVAGLALGELIVSKIDDAVANRRERRALARSRR